MNGLMLQQWLGAHAKPVWRVLSAVRTRWWTWRHRADITTFDSGRAPILDPHGDMFRPRHINTTLEALAFRSLAPHNNCLRCGGPDPLLKLLKITDEDAP